MAKGKYRLSFLLVCLLLILFIYPIFERHQEAGKILALFFTAVLVSGVYAISENNRKILIASIILCTPAVLLIWLDQFVPSDFSGDFILDVVTNISMAIFTFFTAGCILSYIMRVRRVTSDILAGAACTYLLFGVSWGILYLLLEQIVPGSFSAGVTPGVSINDWSIFNYYSFTTLTTLGYGDITPITSRAQSLAILEAATGVLFIALLISRLVGVYITQNIKRAEEK